MSRRPDLFIIGAPKSGTTSLYEYLAGHPEIFMSPRKEPFYFSPDVNRTHRSGFRFEVDEARYLDLFAEARDEKRLGEASTRYMFSPAAPGLIREFQPAAYIVTMLRNPVDMVYALHNELVSLGHEPIGEFDQAIAADADRRAGRRLPHGTGPLLAQYLPQGRYGEQLRRWIKAFGRSRVHVIIFDDFVADTPGEFSRLLRFLEVSPGYSPASFAARNQSHRVRGPVRAAARSRVGQWLRASALTRAVGKNAAYRLASRIRQTRLYLRSNPRPPLATVLRRQLEEEFRPDVEELSQLIDRDLTALWFAPDRRAG